MRVLRVGRVLVHLRGHGRHQHRILHGGRAHFLLEALVECHLLESGSRGHMHLEGVLVVAFVVCAAEGAWCRLGLLLDVRGAGSHTLLVLGLHVGQLVLVESVLFVVHDVGWLLLRGGSFNVAIGFTLKGGALVLLR